MDKRKREDGGEDGGDGEKKQRRSRFSDSAVELPPPSAAAPGLSALQAQLAQQIASVSSLLSTAQQNKAAKKAANYTLKLNAEGKEVDDKGNVVNHDLRLIRSAAANIAVEQQQRKSKKENPYLAHRVAAAAAGGGKDRAAAPETEDAPAAAPGVDERIRANPIREMRAKKALKFVEAGSYLQQAEELRQKEERKAVAGYTSGRKIIERGERGEGEGEGEGEGADGDGAGGSVFVVPSAADSGVVPAVEWWDEAFLPKELRELRRRSVAAAAGDDSSLLDIAHAKTHRYVQHPPCIKPLGGEKPSMPLPMFLTLKERKRIRKNKRAVKEQEKRDKIVMGLLPPPEPKFKLSNFMKLLGEQAVADPSKIEMRVVQQVRKRQLDHEMANHERRLTPAQRREKTVRRLQEDTSKQVHVAVFSIRDFSNNRHRFKVDVNAQQLYLSGIVLLIAEKGAPSVVVVEGGPRAVRKYTNLMTRRIRWSDMAEEEEEEEGGEGEGGGAGGSAADDGADSDVEYAADSAGAPAGAEGENGCSLAWTGVVAKRSFTGFRFQECRSCPAARKALETKAVAHYFDLCIAAP